MFTEPNGKRHERARMPERPLALGYGRFMQPDPIGYAAGMNLYGYVQNDPINFTDPSGMFCIFTNYGWYTPRGEYLGPAGVEISGDCSGGTRPFYGNDDSGIGGGGDTGGEQSKQCPGGHVTVTRLGSNVKISGTLTFVPSAPYFGSGTPTALPGAVPGDVQDFYVDAINSRWSGRFGQYNVGTNMAAGAGGLPTYVSPSGSNGWGSPGGSFIQFANNRASWGSVAAGNLAGHEFGHGLGLGHNPNNVPGLMNANANGRPSGQNIADVISQCTGE